MTIKMRILLFLLLTGLIFTSCNQTETNFLESKDAYFGLTPPGIIPEVFAPGIVSDTSWAEHCQVAVSPKGDEIYWSAWSAKYPPADTSSRSTEQIYFSEFRNGSWTKPALAEFVKNHLTILNGGPVFSPDGKRLYFYSVNRPGGLGSMDTWYVEKTNGKWGKPINAGEPFNSKGENWSPIFTKQENAYFNFGRTIKYKFSDGKFSSPKPIVIHKDFRPIFPIYVSPDESYVIFDSFKEDNFGDLDLYISFKSKDDNWGTPINMGPDINTKSRERFPMVSPDGKYLFFMRHTPGQDFFWVSTKIIDALREKSVRKLTIWDWKNWFDLKIPVSKVDIRIDKNVAWFEVIGESGPWRNGNVYEIRMLGSLLKNENKWLFKQICFIYPAPLKIVE